jgi:hypothetical protein
MSHPATLHDVEQLAEIARARVECAPRLYALVASVGSQRVAWEMLHDAGLFHDQPGKFYAAVRKYGLEATLDGLFTLERLAGIRRLVEGPTPVPLPRVSVSTLANQFYCEMQVHLARSHSLKTESAELAAGAAGHAAFEAEAEEISPEEIDQAITAGESLELVEMPLSAEVAGVRVVGRADRIHLEGRRARLVLEFKFSGRRELFPSHVVQVGAYGRMLEAMGFSTDRLVYAVAVLPRGRKVTDGLATAIAARAFQVAKEGLSMTDARPPSGAPDPLLGLTARRVDDEAYGLWVFRHHRARVERDLTWALQYWTGARPPEGTASRGKCRACPFNAATLCAAAKAPPDGRYAVKRTEGRYGVLHVVQPARRGNPAG